MATGELAAEKLSIAKNNLFFYLCDLGNRGINLWTLDRVLIGFTPYQNIYALPAGTLDVRDALYRVMTPPGGGSAASSAGGTPSNAFDGDPATVCTQTAPNGNISYNFGGPVVVTTVGVYNNGAASYTLALESSTDNTTWTTLTTLPAQTYADQSWVYFDLINPQSAQYFRVRETGGATLSVREINFGTSPNETPMYRMNRDDYANLNFKTMASRMVPQYWFDRQRVSPNVFLWPVPNYFLDSMVLWRDRQIQDVGALTNEIEIPYRWYENVVANLALRLALEIPEAAPRIPMLKDMAALMTPAAELAETDTAPMRLGPLIGSYTR